MFIIPIFFAALILLALAVLIIKFGIGMVLLVIAFIVICTIGTATLLASGLSLDKKRKNRLRVYAGIIFAIAVFSTGFGVSSLEDKPSLRDGQVARHRAHNSDTAGSNPALANAVSLFDNEH